MKNCILLLAVLLAASCTKGETENPGGKADGYVRINSSAVGDQSRALPFGPASAVMGIQFLHKTSESAPAGGVLDFTGVTALAGDRSPGGDVTFTPDAPRYDKANIKSYIKGYYPAGSLTDGVVTWTVDGATDILVSELWDAGTYAAPVTTGLTFEHTLARLEVICRAKTQAGLAAARETWGQITSIKLKAHAPSRTFTYATNTTVASGSEAPFALLNGESYIAGAFTAMDIQAYNSAAIAAAAMVNPTGSSGLTLIIETEKYPGGVEIDVTFEGKTFSASQLHTVTLEFDPADKQIKVLKSAVTPWNTTGMGGGDMHSPTILEYGKAPYSETGGVDKGSTYVSYNSWYGNVAGGHNGNYIGLSTEDLASAEKPYTKFEIAKRDLSQSDGTFGFTWDQAQGTMPGGNMCAKTFGAGWRLPRVTELKLIMYSRTELEQSGNGFIPLDYDNGYDYWSATEESTTQAWLINMDHTTYAKPKGDKLYVRCIRELPPPPPILIGDKTAADAVIGDFSFSDGSFGDGTATLSDAQQDACVGIVYWTGDPTRDDIALERDYPGCKHGLIVSLTEVQPPWQSAYTTYDKSVNEWTIANATGFTRPIISSTSTADVEHLNKMIGYNNTEAIAAFNAAPANSAWKVEVVEEVKNYRISMPVPTASSPWYLPSPKELSLLCGLNPPINGTINNGGMGMDNRDAMNAQLAKITGATQLYTESGYAYYWTSMEGYDYGVYKYSWVIPLSGNGSAGWLAKNANLVRARFVRAF